MGVCLQRLHGVRDGREVGLDRAMHIILNLSWRMCVLMVRQDFCSRVVRVICNASASTGSWAELRHKSCKELFGSTCSLHYLTKTWEVENEPDRARTC